MKIGIISDSHDRVENLNKSIDIFNKEGVEVLIHCGDFCAPSMIKEMRKFKGEIHCVFGNIDDEYTSTKFAIDNGINLHGAYADLKIDGKKIGVVHFPFLAECLALSGKFDAVFYGHNHKKNKEKKGKAWLVNPGELAGMKGKASCAIYNTTKDNIEYIEIK